MADNARYERHIHRAMRRVQVGAGFLVAPLLAVAFAYPWLLAVAVAGLPVLWRRSQPAAVVAAVSVGLVLAVALGASVGVTEMRMVSDRGCVADVVDGSAG